VLKTIYINELETIHSFANIPKRIISLVPSQTELLYDLGLEDSIVGITKFCMHPIHLKSTKTIVGGTKQVKIEKIKAENPDIIIANKEENTKEMVLELSKICPVLVTDIATIEDNLQMISYFGQLFDKRMEAQKWNDKISFAYFDFQNFIAERTAKKVAYFIWAKPYMVAGFGTFINELLKLNRFENVFGDKGRYPEIKLEELRQKYKVDLILLSSEPFPFKDKQAVEIGKFTNQAMTIFADGEYFSWYGSRLLKAFDYFKKLHQNELDGIF
jgi:ABC-type Fe3+-hydroxamate transport system substrate-binding protein